MLSEKEKEAVRVEAREILVRFGKALEGVKTVPISSSASGTLRRLGKACSDEEFRERMFANAPHKTNDSIVAEKAHW
ncbi:MAG: hypothetical protein AABX53_01790 [Nanoarchaeota archaeon]